MKNKLCSQCNTNYYPKENDISNIGEYMNCYRDPEGFYLDKKDSLYKKCYESCETCETKGDNIIHNCIKCKKNYDKEIIFNDYLNCYEKCRYYYYFDNYGVYHCTLNSFCPDEYPFLIKDRLECIIDLNEKVKALVPNISDYIIKGINEEEIKYYNKIIENFGLFLMSKEFEISYIDSGNDLVLKTKKLNITFTSTENQKNNINNNTTSIQLGYCETLLKNLNNLTENETLYIRKLDIYQEGMNIPKIEYDVYYKQFGMNLTKLDLSICEDSKISLLMPLEIKENENIDKLNTSSGYFNNKCYQASSESGTDISLKDRKKEYVEGNKAVCQEDCSFSNYIKISQKANCSCDIKESDDDYAKMNINKEKLYENFGNSEDKKEVTNLGITSCDVLSSSENIKSNTGFFLLLLILAIFIIIFIIFCTRGYDSLKNKIDEVIYKKFDKGIKNKNNEIKIKTKENIKIKKQNNKEIKSIKKDKKNSLKKSVNNTKKGLFHNLRTNRQISTKLNRKGKVKNQLNNIPQCKPDTDYELNWLSYEEAIKYDKRTNCDYYCSLIKNKQLFIFTFCSFNDYNSGVVRKFMFFLSFALHYTVNALFFTEANIHQIYEDEGKFNFNYQIPQILFSALISNLILRLMMQFLVLTDKDILQVKLQQSKDLAIKMKNIKLMKVKFTIFFILNFILLGLFWYYLTCFNAIYKNTQTYLIINTFISFGFSLFYPIIINIFPTMIRICAINSSNKDQKYCYRISQILQLI